MRFPLHAFLLASLIVCKTAGAAEPKAVDVDAGKPDYDLKAAKQVEVAKVSERLDLDAYGGSEKIQGVATGWFALQEIKGRWWLITPEGHAMISLEVVHVGQIQQQPIYAAAYHGDPVVCMKDVAD